ncbi:Uncharacterised protein [Mycobacterium tuberculosis]|nr:Uncharacterised protein [Mycobacterium tuberculosis]
MEYHCRAPFNPQLLVRFSQSRADYVLVIAHRTGGRANHPLASETCPAFGCEPEVPMQINRIGSDGVICECELKRLLQGLVVHLNDIEDKSGIYEFSTQLLPRLTSGHKA